MFYHDPHFNSYEDYYRYAVGRGNTPLTESAIAYYVTDAIDRGFPIAEMEDFLASNAADWARLSVSFEAYAHETAPLVYTGPGNAFQTIGALVPSDTSTIMTVAPSSTPTGQPMSPTAVLPSGTSAPSIRTSGPPGAFGYGMSAGLTGGAGGLSAGIGGIPLWLLVAVGVGVWLMTRKG